jgi:DNA-binding NtrC family response regulator
LGANEPEYLKGFPDFDKWLHEQSGTLAELEANYVNEILAATKGNKAEAARILGISRKNISESPDVIWSNG